MNQPMPSTWRRLPLATTEYEWFSAFPLPRSCGAFRVLVHHQRNADVVRATVLTARGEDPILKVDAVRRQVPQAEGAKTHGLTLDELLRRFYLPRLFTTYGFDRRPLAEALRAALPLPLHNDAQRTMRAFLYEKHRLAQQAHDRAHAVKKPRVYRELAQIVGRALYKLADRADTWLWGGPR